eukprot:TRINITY_DN835_c0_g1_i10.p1 TRINITY_DN835_c0_g1~~TRINITY_DN835_c0_g1_i10.p1  ORF type:complete len:1217 (+),score=202.47 TRINITY_DN835_c0_g1_i10:36-3653(+)
MQLLAGLFTIAATAVIPEKITVPGWEVCGSGVTAVSGFDPNWVEGGNTQSEIEGGMTFTTKQWGRTYLYFRFDATLPELVRDNSYEVEFDLKVTKAPGDDAAPEFAHQPGLLLWANTETAKSKYVRSYIWYEDAYVERPEYFAFPEVAMEGPSAPPGEFERYSASFTAPERYNNPTQAVWVRLSLVNRPERDVVSFSVRNICIRKPELSVDPPPTLSKYSTKFQITHPTEPAASEYEQANCPFAAGDLVSWTSLGFSDSASVKLPDNTKVLLSRSDVIEGLRYEKIEVPETSSLVFNDEAITLTVRSFLVRGKLLIGGPGCRVAGPIRIVFWGSRTDADTLDGFGSKGLAAVGLSSFVDMYGKRYYPTWTRLARKVRAGDDRAYLQRAVNWEVGQEVVLTTTIWDDTGRGTEPQNEVHTIKAISDDRLTIQFEANVKYVHYAGTEYQGEVALLTRTVSMEGEPSADGYGGHSIASNARARFAGVSTRFMGQTNILARYPFHLHMMGKNTGSLISDCVARDTYFRCFTIHGTNDTTVSENVAFNATGSCFYIEDGVEENNVFSHNLAAHVHPIGEAASGGSQSGVTLTENKNARGLNTNDRLFPADAAAAAYYISNSYNEFHGNVASGGWAGYSFPSLPYTVGSFKDDRFIQPHSRSLKKFTGNVCHSSGAYWNMAGCIYVGGELKMAGNVLKYMSGKASRPTIDEGGNHTWMLFENTLIYSSLQGMMHWGERVEMDRFEMHDITRSATLFGEAWLNNGLVNGYSGNVEADFENKHHDGFQFPDTTSKSVVTDIIFRNYKTDKCYINVLPGMFQTIKDPSYCEPDPAKGYDGWSVNDHSEVVWSGVFDSDEFKPQQISATRGIRFEDVEYQNLVSFKIVNTGASRMFNFIDFDGSATLEGFPTIVGSNLPWWNICSDCRFESQWSVWLCPKQPVGEVEEREVLHVKFTTPEITADNGGIESSGACQKAAENDYADWSNCDVGHMTLWGSDPTRKTPITSNAGVTGLSGTGWFMELDGGSPRVLEIVPEQVPIGSTFRFAVGYPAGTTFTITASHRWKSNSEVTFTAADSLTELMSSKSATQYFFDGNTLYLFPRPPEDIQVSEGKKFERGGAYVYSTVRTWTIRVEASCGVDSKGFCSTKPVNVLPPWDVPCPSGRPAKTTLAPLGEVEVPDTPLPYIAGVPYDDAAQSVTINILTLVSVLVLMLL